MTIERYVLTLPYWQCDRNPEHIFDIDYPAANEFDERSRKVCCPECRMDGRGRPGLTKRYAEVR